LQNTNAEKSSGFAVLSRFGVKIRKIKQSSIDFLLAQKPKKFFK